MRKAILTHEHVKLPQSAVSLQGHCSMAVLLTSPFQLGMETSTQTVHLGRAALHIYSVVNQPHESTTEPTA